jgi:hypothetical protein
MKIEDLLAPEVDHDAAVVEVVHQLPVHSLIQLTNFTSVNNRIIFKNPS